MSSTESSNIHSANDTSDRGSEEVILEAEVLSEESHHTSDRKDRRPGNLAPLLLTFVLATALLGGLFWVLNQQFTQGLQQQLESTQSTSVQNQQGLATLQGELKGELSKITTELASQQTRTAGFDSRIQQQRQGFEALQTRLESSLQKQEQMVQQLIHSNREQSRQLSDSVAALARRIDRRESNLHTAAALRLLQIAEEQLMIVKDFSTTQQALAQAGQQITATGDPILLPIHELIQQELKRVRDTVVPDLPAALQQLQTVMEQGATLPFSQPVDFEHAPAVEAEATEWSWEAIGNKIWRDLLTLVRIDKEENELPVIATRSEERLSHLILRLRLEQAQSALLLRDTNLFHERIKHAQAWLKVFDSTSDAVAALQQQLSALLTLELQPTLPTIGEAHRRLREIVAQRASQQAQETTTEEHAS